VDSLIKDWRQAKLSRVDAALCAYADKLTRTPAEITGEDIKDLKSQGLTDCAIHDAAQVVGYFNYINRVAEGLGVDLEPEMKPE
jgi:uncharacterized peroxidase-related enzyme